MRLKEAMKRIEKILRKYPRFYEAFEGYVR
jgi:hypothetical protein